MVLAIVAKLLRSNVFAQVYSITAQKAVASHVGEGNLGPCRLPLTSLPEEQLPGLLAEYLPLLQPMGTTHAKI